MLHLYAGALPVSRAARREACQESVSCSGSRGCPHTTPSSEGNISQRLRTGRLRSAFSSTASDHQRARLKSSASVSPSQSTPTGSKGWDILGLGQAMVDFSAAVDDSFLEQIGIAKGGRRIITLEERAHLLELLNGQYQINAGGSLANTLANMGRLSSASELDASGRSSPLRVAAASIVGGDALGSFHSAQQSKAGVTTLSHPIPDSCTGTVIVLTTPDANRTFLSYLGTPQTLEVDDSIADAVSCSRVVAVEGYIWETPSAAQQIGKVVELAQQSGSLVGLTAGDANVVNRHYSEIWQILSNGIDILFANRQEAQALLKSHCTAEEAALRLGPYSGVVVITDGANGSCISAMGSLKVVPPFWSTSKPTDTCGAGDAYAAGFLHGYLTGLDPPNMGAFGARVASAVIGRRGASLSQEEAMQLVQKIPTVHPMEFLKSAGFSSS